MATVTARERGLGAWGCWSRYSQRSGVRRARSRRASSLLSITVSIADHGLSRYRPSGGSTRTRRLRVSCGDRRDKSAAPAALDRPRSVHPCVREYTDGQRAREQGTGTTLGRVGMMLTCQRRLIICRLRPREKFPSHGGHMRRLRLVASAAMANTSLTFESRRECVEIARLATLLRAKDRRELLHLARCYVRASAPAPNASRARTRRA